MLNFRRLKQDFSPNVLQEGKKFYDEGMVLSAKILTIDGSGVRIGATVRGNFDNVYESEVEIDRQASELTDSNCDCSYQFDCGHLAALLFYLEDHFDALLVDFSKEADLESSEEIDEEEKQGIQETLLKAQKKESEKKDKKHQKELLAEYGSAAAILGDSPFFLPDVELAPDKAELAVIVAPKEGKIALPEMQLALRLPLRSKPLYIPHVPAFLEAIRYREPQVIGGRRYYFTLDSFGEESRIVLRELLDAPLILDEGGERGLRVVALETKIFGALLAKVYEVTTARLQAAGYSVRGGEKLPLPGLYFETLEKPLTFSAHTATLRVVLDTIDIPAPKLFLKPTIIVDQNIVGLDDVALLECAKPGLIYETTYYRFSPKVRRLHLHDLFRLRDVAIPEPLFGAFVENSLPELMRFAEVSGREELENIVTLPYVGDLKARCEIQYLDGELEATLWFNYDGIEVPATHPKLSFEQATAFIDETGVLARNLVEERCLVNDLFDGFIYNSAEGSFVAKTEKKIVEFMTELIPSYQDRVDFECPENLLDQFLYDETVFELKLKESQQVDSYTVQMAVSGHLKGLTFDRLWESICSKRTFIELEKKEADSAPGRKKGSRPNKILVLDLEKLTPVVQFFDELGIRSLDNHEQERPLWSLASIQPSAFKKLPVKVSMSKKPQEIQQQMLGQKTLELSPIPESVNAELRTYQVDGVNWLERLRRMHLSGILADDMGLGKTVQAITAITQHVEANGHRPSLVVCPTSLVYNWNEEFARFNPKIKVLVVDGTPAQRKKLILKAKDYDVIVTSYSLVQKDVEHYQAIDFAYAVLDEAQHIKNRGTRNAKSVKQIKAAHRLILTGTPIENSLEELWSLFDFLMPGLLSSYDRFLERYIRSTAQETGSPLDTLSRKVAPFILRRMKCDVLDDLPPVNEMIYYCHLSKVQKELYQAYAASAREELARLVQKEGFDRVQIHVLATLTRLKQICCHPAIFAKEEVEENDSSKYDMMLELLHSLIEGKHKTVIFSQYTQMLKIMRNDLEKLGIRYAYLDGSSKNRMDIVRGFNEDPNIMVFLVSLKAGGTGLNLTGADAVIHYDLWWNPAVQEQATDRVHRIGQTKQVSSIKLVTLGTIEEKVLELQKRKKGLVKKVVSADDEVVSKLTWEEVLELLQV